LYPSLFLKPEPFGDFTNYNEVGFYLETARGLATEGSWDFRKGQGRFPDAGKTGKSEMIFHKIYQANSETR